jgi:hypothetical protein
MYVFLFMVFMIRFALFNNVVFGKYAHTVFIILLIIKYQNNKNMECLPLFFYFSYPELMFYKLCVFVKNDYKCFFSKSPYISRFPK